MLLGVDTVSARDALLIAGASGTVGAFIGGGVTLKVARDQLRAEIKRQWREVAASAYATTLAVGSEFNAQSALVVATQRHVTGDVPDTYPDTRRRASEALGDLERTSVLSDDPAVQAAADSVSRLLREIDYSWGQLIGWRIAVLNSPPGSAAAKGQEAQVDRLNVKLDGHLAELYGEGGVAGGELANFRDAIRASGPARAWWRRDSKA